MNINQLIEDSLGIAVICSLIALLVVMFAMIYYAIRDE